MNSLPFPKEFLYPNDTAPVPLDENFYARLTQSVQNGVAGNRQQIHPSGSGISTANGNGLNYAQIRPEPIAERLVRENEKLIEEEALKQVAAEAVNVAGNQYDNLIQLSFDEDELIRREEEKRRKKREKMAAAVLKR